MNEQRQRVIDALSQRFAQHRHRHADVDWADVLDRLQRHPAKLDALRAMEDSAGEPDVIGAAEHDGSYLFFDCSKESPAGRRSLCYDDEALRSRKQNKPMNSAVGLAASMGVSLLTQEQYLRLQEWEEFDLKTSSWIATPPDVRSLGGALFCDRRYGKVFTYHNGAESYYAARGFRVALRL